MSTAFDRLNQRIVACEKCPRLRVWCTKVAAEKRAAFRDQTYFGKPVPNFGDPEARLLILGLAPAAHGANRTGRMFTGDRSGEWLYRALWRAGLANQPGSTSRDDGLELRHAWVTSPVKCAPPANKPTPDERRACAPFLAEELALLDDARVIVALGKFGFDAVCDHLGLRPRPTTGELKGRIEHHDGGVFAVAREMGTVAATDLAETISEADTIAAWVFVASGNSTTDLINGGLSAIPPVDDAPGMPLLGAQDTLGRVLRSCRR